MPQWLGVPEIIVLVVVISIVFGWKKLPDAARSLGRSMRIFKAEVEEMKKDPRPSAASRDTVEGRAMPPEQAPADPASAGTASADPGASAGQQPPPAGTDEQPSESGHDGSAHTRRP